MPILERNAQRWRIQTCQSYDRIFFASTYCTVLMSHDFDVVIVGASFAGLTMAHYLPKDLKVLIIDSKPSAGFTVESTGLITVKTREEFSSFFPIDDYITNAITSICVVAPGFQDSFISTTDGAWIYQTDTKGLVKHLGDSLPDHVTLRTSTTLIGVHREEETIQSIEVTTKGKKETITCKFLVGADGGRSKVAQMTRLQCNKKFLIGLEQVYWGSVHLGPNPEETIYHCWFGEFSLGYGGWLSPTILDGKKAFRIGLAKLQKDHKEVQSLLRKFTEILLQNGTIRLQDPNPFYSFGSSIPIGGALKRISSGNVLLIGDAAGLCGAFAADGIKGAVVSGKEGAKVITSFLEGKTSALASFPKKINQHGHLMEYYGRQLRYRWIWDLMKKDRTFRAMFDIIAAESASFLDQFCDSKDKRKSLTRVVLKWRHLGKLLKYSWCILLDQFPFRLR